VSHCPECDALIEEEFEDVGDIITCPECGVELEVTSIDPLEFDLAPIDEEEDDEFGFDDADDEDEWDDEDSYDDDDDNGDYYDR
jgi:alpha-aminoadipate carrier protein LysW